MTELLRPLTDRAARLLLSRVAEPYDEKVQELVAAHGVADLVGYAIRDGRTPEGDRLDRLRSRLPTARDVDERQICGSLGARVLVPGDEEWPTGLDDLQHPPWCLWVRGPLGVPEATVRSVAMVGSRASTAYGDEVTARMAYGLVERGFTTVSGAAYGIDAAAHRATLRADGLTVAVLAGGIDVPYPRANTDLLVAIARTGAVVSETPPGGAPARMRFLARNRIIAALTPGTVVVEANLRSGARSTAREARDLGRHVMAVPGPVTSAMSSGCHEEIRLGSTLVTDAAEVADLVGRIGEDMAPVKRGEDRPEDSLEPETRRVWQWLRPRASTSVDELMIRSGLDLGEVLVALAELEQLGLADHLLDGWKRAGGRR
ncbi:DNA-processing protein DprA [Ornithinimicrobium avium]|uniref:DNA-protecting protein DprA n=1 Tax=Ornithinimicrobium avium TaxID=2283195 RepID=A0A345NIN1_9MICO|nr:DNA-processing protein DprA [Ornithinimicrobium avium]AXH94889.1 DNA-protecting protein DprA [Ornithinimicrobium avium]